MSIPAPGWFRRRRKSGSVVYPGRFRRHPVIAAVVVLLLVVAVLDRGFGRLGRSDDYSRYDNRRFRVVHVVDGDTLDIDRSDGKFPTTRVRLWGVDTPEVDGSPQGRMYYGPEASAFVRKTLTDATVRIVLSPTRTRDKYRRLLGYVYIEPDGACLNEVLLETGHAYADTRFDHPHKKKYEAAERRASRQGVGLWADVKPEQYPAWRQGKR